MKKIVILSDTHGLLRPEVQLQLESADVILHAGDIDTPEVAACLRACAETHFVRGNNDHEWAEGLPRRLSITIENLRFFMTHSQADVPRDLSGVDIVVFGHSHRYAMEERSGVLWLNPGSCGRRRFDLPLTFCTMEADGCRYRVEKHSIPG